MSDIQKQFDEKITTLENVLPHQKGLNNCAASTLTNILEVLNIEDYRFYNLAIPLAGGFGGFKSQHGVKGPCGAVCGGCAAIGIIMAGKEKLNDKDMAKVYLKTANYVENFEAEFDSITCQELCGIDFSDPKGYKEYLNRNLWEKTCSHYVIWAIDEIRNLTSLSLKKKWAIK